MSANPIDQPAMPGRLALLGERLPITLGRSGALVWRIVDSAETLFLKAEAAHALAELPGEAERLRWLDTMGVAAPRVRESFAEDGYHWLLMTALPGADLTQHVDQPVNLRNALAHGLRALHELNPAACPFDHRLERRLRDGAANAAAGRVDESDFDQARADWTTQGVLDWLQQHRPTAEDLVVTHGDASLPNLMADGSGFSGVIDVGRLGAADRWQDLAIACRSLIYNCGSEHVPPFLEAYGTGWDEERYRYYCTLDELF